MNIQLPRKTTPEIQVSNKSKNQTVISMNCKMKCIDTNDVSSSPPLNIFMEQLKQRMDIYFS